ncbi:DNA-directed RNA polymerase II core subunit rpb9 [Basidiobolus ranarum]|uniref:DNA-directed RNA polymerase II subunit RPB9 n=1 Tax=Basidiobolus ranarum TaxID=34480 RepID=A0ABR2X342_9FUNG
MSLRKFVFQSTIVLWVFVDSTYAFSEQTMIMTDLGFDPTLPRTNIACPSCGHTEAVFFQSRSRRPETKMTLFYVCCNGDCNHRWVSA